MHATFGYWLSRTFDDAMLSVVRCCYKYRHEHSTLLADPAAIQLEKIVSHDRAVTLVVKTTGRDAACPRCQYISARIHSRYLRRVADLPWLGVAVTLELQTRRFRCTNSLCRQRIFCERLPTVVTRYAHQTARLTDALRLIGFAIGGEAGARTAVELGMSTSPDTLLRRIRQAALEERQTPRVLGVDDWAFRRGCRYGTFRRQSLRRYGKHLGDGGCGSLIVPMRFRRPGIGERAGRSSPLMPQSNGLKYDGRDLLWQKFYSKLS